MADVRDTLGYMFNHQEELKQKVGTCPHCGCSDLVPYFGFNNVLNKETGKYEHYMMTLCCKKPI